MQVIRSVGSPWAQPRSADRIDLTEASDLSFWTSELSCSAHELYGAIQHVGIDVDAVKSHLKAKKPLLAKS